MFRKVQPIYIVLTLTIIIVIVGLFLMQSYFGLKKETALSIGAVILAPVLAILVGEYLRQRTERQREEYETLKKLVAFRHSTSSSEFLNALNQVILIFDRNKEIKSLVKKLWEGYSNGENQSISKRRIVELIYAICKHTKRDVTEFEIDSFFISANNASSPPPLSSTPTNPNSTANHNGFTTKTNSQTSCSITAGSFLDF